MPAKVLGKKIHRDWEKEMDLASELRETFSDIFVRRYFPLICPWAKS